MPTRRTCPSCRLRGNQTGFNVCCRSIFDLGSDFLAKHAVAQRDQSDRILRGSIKPDPLIIADMGLRARPKPSGEYLLEAMVRRYDTHSRTRPATGHF